MAYVALYRKWRPQDFENLVGQDHISRTLKNAVVSGKIAHAYLFSGPRGTGKTSTAKILAKALNCVQGPTPTPCNECPNCRRITTGSSMDVFEIDAASNRGIDEIRDLRETVKFAPVDGRYKVYIIDEVHMLTTEAFNALLKTLEEPPAHVVFILATTEAHKIPATIHSRCQRYDFRRIGVPEIESRLTEVVKEAGLNVGEDAIRLIAAHADGGMRDALSILDQCASLETHTVTAENVRQLLGLIGHEWVWKLTGALAEKDFAAVLSSVDELIQMGKDVRQILLELVSYFRSLMLYKTAPEMNTIELYGSDPKVLEEHSGKFKYNELIESIETFHAAANEAKWAPEPRITAEVALLKVCRRLDEHSIEALLKRVELLEQRLAGGTGTVPPEPAVYSRAVAPRQTAVPAKPAPVQAPAPQAPVSQVPAASTRQAEAVHNSGEMPELPEVWDRLLKELISSGKRSVHACVAQGQLVSLSDSQAVLQFAAAFPKERTEKDDYRAILESILLNICGKPIQLRCTLGATAAPVKPAVQAKPDPIPPAAAVAEEQHPVLREALKMFGGKVIKQE